MSNPYEMFKTDEVSETKGIEIDYGEFKFTVARAGGSNSKYNKLLEKETKKYRRQIQSGQIDAKILEDILVKVFAKTIMLGWEGVKNKEGEMMAYNYENCITLFTDLPDLFADIRDQATNMEYFKEAAIEREAKN